MEQQFIFNDFQLVNKTIDFKDISVSYGYSKNGYVKKDGRQSIVYKLYRNKRYIEIPSGLYTYNSIISDEYRKTLVEQSYKIQTAILSIPNRHLLSLSEIKLLISKHQVKTARFIDFGKSYIAQSKRSDGTKYNYNGVFKDIELFNSSLLISDFDYSIGQKYIKFLEDKGKTPNQISVKIQQIKTILTAAEKYLELPHSTFHNIEIINKQKSVKSVYLTAEDVKKLETFKFKKNHKDK